MAGQTLPETLRRCEQNLGSWCTGEHGGTSGRPQTRPVSNGTRRLPVGASLAGSRAPLGAYPGPPSQNPVASHFCVTHLPTPAHFN